MKQLITLGALVVWCLFIYAFIQFHSQQDTIACETVYKVSMKDKKNIYQDVMNPERYNIQTNTWGGYSSQV